jgi:hypothetical protein
MSAWMCERGWYHKVGSPCNNIYLTLYHSTN